MRVPNQDLRQIGIRLNDARPSSVGTHENIMLGGIVIAWPALLAWPARAANQFMARPPTIIFGLGGRTHAGGRFPAADRRCIWLVGLVGLLHAKLLHLGRTTKRYDFPDFQTERYGTRAVVAAHLTYDEDLMAGRTLMQFFHWYTPDGGGLWKEVAEKAESLAKIGVTDVWLPPAYKGSAGGFSVGYDTYDLFDLGEFEQKGTVATKYGDRAALENAAGTLKANGVNVILDVVFNHKMGADEKEQVRVRSVDENDRTKIDDQEFEALAYTRFTFPGRNGTHSKFIWDQKCFSGVDVIEQPDEKGIFRLVNEYGDGEWNDEVDQENGNFDFLMGADVEFRNNAVYEELKYWGRWVSEQIPVDGFRLDAAKHIPAWFFKDWVGHMRDTVGKDLFVVAEYWHPDMEALKLYLDLVDRQLQLFDVALHHMFHEASKAGAEFDMRSIFDGSLVSAFPEHAVTLVDNHDTQPLQSLEAAVDPWFKPLAYALILLREHGTPCVFYPDLYGANYTEEKEGHTISVDMPAIGCLPKLMEARARFANGSQTDIFDDAHCVAFVRHGTADAPGCVVVMSNGEGGEKQVELEADHAGVYVDFLGHRQERIEVGDDGKATFPTNSGSVSVWVRDQNR